MMQDRKPEAAAETGARNVRTIGPVDQGLPDIARSRAIEQEVLDLLDEDLRDEI